MERGRPLGLVLAGLAAAACSAPPTTQAVAPAPAAQEPAPAWTPPAPEDTTHDWVRLKTDEWLRGKIRSLYRQRLEFESDELGTLALDLDDVAEVRAGRAYTILRADRSTVSGMVTVDGETVTVRRGDETVRTTRDDVTRMVAGSPRERDNWSGKLALGASLRSGNTDQLDTTGRFTALRRTANSRIDLSLVSNYTEISDETTADNTRFLGKHDRFLSPRLYLTTLSLELFRDPFSNIERRIVPATGLGMILADTGRFAWDVDGLLGYRFTKYSSVAAGDDDTEGDPNAILGTSLSADLTEKLALNADYGAQVSLDDLADTNHNLSVVLSFDAWGDVDFDFSFVWQRVGQPQPDEDGNVPLRDDFRIGVGVGWSF